MTTLKHVDLDKRIVVYPRKLKQGTTWYARFLVEKRELINGQRYLRESMKTSSEEIAKQKALQRYAELSVFQKNDFVIKNITVDEGIKRFMKDFKEKSKQGLDILDIEIYLLLQIVTSETMKVGGEKIL